MQLRVRLDRQLRNVCLIFRVLRLVIVIFLLTPPPWDRWSSVPRDPDLLPSLGPWCLEVFSRKAGITKALRDEGLRVLPPLDITLEGEVRESADILDAELFDFVLLLVQVGAVDYLHLGTPCCTFSIARTRPGGPPPLRSEHFPLGLPGVAGQSSWQDPSRRSSEPAGMLRLRIRSPALCERSLGCKH